MIVRFEHFELNTDRYTLHHQREPVTVEPQVFAVLTTLIQHRDRVVTKQELIDNIWNGRIMSDAAISSRIKSARQAIDDDGKQQRLIKTVHGIGFRFIGDVEIEERPSDKTSSSLETKPEPDNSQPSIDIEEKRPSIIILPFQTSERDQNSILHLGLAHDIITALSRLRWLKVIARGSAFQLSNQPEQLESLCQLTAVQYCLAGALEINNRQMDIHLQLTTLPNGEVIWADHIQCSIEAVHDTRTRIIKQAISLLERRVSENEAQKAQLKSPENLDAWEAYHLGMSHLYRFNEKHNLLASQLFQRAINLESSFARAHAGLSAAEFQNAFNCYQSIDREAAVTKAIKHAEESIALDSMDPLTNFVMGRTYWLSADTEKSLPFLERAIALNPNYAQGYYAHGLASLMTHNDDRGYQEADKAVSLSPLDPFLYGFYGVRAFSHLADNNLEQTQLWAEKAAMQPESLPVIDLLAAAACEMNQDLTSAKAWLSKAQKRYPSISSDYFFKALPFTTEKIRGPLATSFKRLDLD